MSDTPRTDMETYDVVDSLSDNVVATNLVDSDFARTLERELNAARARIAELEGELESHAWKISPAMAEARIEQLFDENEQLKKRLTSSERSRVSLSDACDSLQAEIRGIKAELSRTKLERDVEADAVTLLTQPKPAPTPLPRPDKPGWWWQLRGREWLMRCISYRIEGDPGQWLPATPPPAPKTEEEKS